jgi:hypothetical protein
MKCPLCGKYKFSQNQGSMTMMCEECHVPMKRVAERPSYHNRKTIGTSNYTKKRGSNYDRR